MFDSAFKSENLLRIPVSSERGVSTGIDPLNLTLLLLSYREFRWA
ncbi:hypothetical protein PL9214640126 [Planktothrix tepida PCC 9214]|uniref:Uncharacterized protein n=1 Tax=Planktothrix tepida PCC 9214 TaxID=671072 RepID=A0A1J1LNX2_9CYAN|nr:hypothetical protein PL9214640126 [Planktothrix tepida PCC 9214]